MASGYLPTTPRVTADIAQLVRDLGDALGGARSSRLNLDRAEREMVAVARGEQRLAGFRSVVAQADRRLRLDAAGLHAA